MREVKYRAWDKDAKKMRAVTQLYFVDGILDQVNTKGGNWLDSRDCEILQFTGLKDKNEKDIYEGDIVRLLDTRIEEVKCRDFATGCTPYNDDYCFDGEQTEVIGNIFENPELLQ